MAKETNLNENLKRLTKINEWFEEQDEIDVEEGLKLVKEAAILIKACKERLKKIENEFDEIKKEIEDDGELKENDNKNDNNDEENNQAVPVIETEDDDSQIDVKDIPF